MSEKNYEFTTPSPGKEYVLRQAFDKISPCKMAADMILLMV